jgi:hypothetical protein
MPEADWLRFATNLKEVELPLGQVIYEAGSEQPYVYFPTDSIISLLYVMKDGSRPKSRLSGMKASSASPCSWEATRLRAAPSCKAPERHSG